MVLFRETSVLRPHGGDALLGDERLRRDVARDPRAPGVPADAQGADPRHQHQARQRIEGLDALRHGVGVASEVRAIGIRIGRDRLLDPGARLALVGRIRQVDPERQRLRPDQVVGRERRRYAELAGPFGVEQIEHLPRHQWQQHHASVGAVRVAARGGQASAQQRCHPAEPLVRLVEGSVTARRQAPATLRFEGGLGARHQLDHAVVRLPRAVAPGHDAVVHPDHADGVGMLLPRRGDELREPKAGEDVGQHDHVRPQCLAHLRFTVGLIGECQDRIRVGVIHEALGDEGVNGRLDGRSGGARIEEMAAQLGLDRHVVELFQRAHPLQRGQLDGDVSLGLDAGEIVARRLDEQGLQLVAEDVRLRPLQRRVPAAVQDEGGLGPDEPARIGAQGELVPEARPVAGLELVGGRIGPAVLHRYLGGSRSITRPRRSGSPA
jgi:hypothetical protein